MDSHSCWDKFFSDKIELKIEGRSPSAITRQEVYSVQREIEFTITCVKDGSPKNVSMIFVEDFASPMTKWEQLMRFEDQRITFYQGVNKKAVYRTKNYTCFDTDECYKIFSVPNDIVFPQLRKVLDDLMLKRETLK